jgi:hypothetical protein
MAKKLLLITMGLSLVVGGAWASQGQDPAPQKPSSVRTDPPTVGANMMQTDLSGTYAGTFKCEALGLTGDTTLTINGNEFTTADGKTGRIVASTTGGYTAVALQTGGTGPAAAPTIVSLRARKSGNRLTLTSAGGPAQKCSFMPTRNVARNKRNQRTPAATGAEVSSPAAMPSAVPTESPMPSQTPSPSPSPNPTPSGSPSPSPSPTPPSEPMPSPTPSPGEPVPSPTPSPGEPMPSPTPTPSPSPSPSPQPRA